VSAALKNGVKIDVGVSLDGVGEHHDQIRGVEGNFKKVDYLINKLNELKQGCDKCFSIVAGLTLHPLTINYIQEVKDYTQKMGIEFLVQLYDEAPYYHNVGKTSENKELDQYTQKMIQAVADLKSSYHNELLIKIMRDKIIKFDCFTMRTFFILRSNGDVMPCLRMCDVMAGNVRKSTPSQIWLGNKASEVRKMIKNCQGCANTWATDWSVRCNPFPFMGIFSNVLKKKVVK